MIKPKIDHDFVKCRSTLTKFGSQFAARFTLQMQHNPLYSYTNDFKAATSMLKEMIKFETENIGVFQNKKHKGKRKSNKVAPVTVDDAALEEYHRLKDDYKKIVFKLLNIRREFSK